MTSIKKKCFVLMPFTDTLREIYTEIYKPACERNNLACWRVDELTRPGSITRDIIDGILDADVIIADLTSRNPNVFYELGIAHSIGNKTLMTCQDIKDVPFDIANYRIILYEHTLNGCKELASTLDSAIKELLRSPGTTNNPFQEVVSMRAGGHKSGRIPLSAYLNISRIHPKIREYLHDHDILYKDQLKPNHLDEIVKIPGLRPKHVSWFFQQLAYKNGFDDKEYLHKFILMHGIYTNEKWYKV